MLALGSTWTAYALNGAVGLCQPGAACASRPAVARMVMTPAAGKAEEQLVQQWVPPVPWEVHKFGGASLATADLYKECSDLLVDESRKGLARDGSWAPTMVIVSAKGGVTDKLIAVVNAARSDMAESARLLRIVADEQVEVVRAIADADVAAEVEARIRADEEDILMVVRAVSLIKTVPATTMELVTGYGEVWSAQTMHAYLQSAGVPSAWLDAREVLVVEQTGGAAGLGDKGSSNVMGTDPVWPSTAKRLAAWWQSEEHAPLLQVDFQQTAPVVVVTGFVATLEQGTPTTLKRSGSDYSATIFARLMAASRITMWKNVNGVYTADPRRVPEAFPITSLKFDEAIELAYFGAQVLHPSAMSPCIEGKIPIYVRNFQNPDHPGTVIEGRACTLSTQSDARAEMEKGQKSCIVPLGDNDSPIRGITSVDSVALITLEGTGIVSVPDANQRLFAALRAASVQPTMVTQASADSSICLVVAEEDAQRAEAFLAEAFERELSKKQISSLDVEQDLSIVAIVGEGMAFRPGVGATFTKAMANAGVNIRAIAQGSSERQISLVVEKEDCTKALRAAHAALALSNSQLSVGVLGATGKVGKELLQQLASTGLTTPSGGEGVCARREAVEELRVDLKVTALSTSKKMILSYNGVQCEEGAADCMDSDESQPSDLEKFTQFISEDYNGNRVLIDCTSSQEVADYYERWLEMGVNVITANKKIGSGPYDKYASVVQVSKKKAQWLYETTGPGSGLPVLSTIKNMRQSGDVIKKVEGVFSGTLSYLLHAIAEGTPFSEALRQANDFGYCEPDPREDISFLDVRRKTVVIARELGLQTELDDVQCESLLPEALSSWEPDTSDGAASVAEQLIEALRPYDDELAARAKAAAEAGTVLTPIGRVDLEAGKAEVGLEGRKPTSRLANSQGNDNVIAITSNRYSAQPLIIQGPGAGAEITASGLFADLLQVARSSVEWTIRA